VVALVVIVEVQWKASISVWNCGWGKETRTAGLYTVKIMTRIDVPSN